MKKKFLSFLMVICLVLGMLPTSALAAGNAMDFDLELRGKTQGLKANDEVTVDFYIRNNVGGLAALQWDLCYDSAVFKVKEGSGTSAAAPAGFTAWVPTFKANCITGGADTASPTTEAIPDLKIYSVTFVALVDITDPTVIEIKDLSEGTYFGDMTAYVDSYSALTGKTKKKISVNISGNLPVSIAVPIKGGTPDTTLTDTKYNGTIDWTPSVSGTYAPSTEYTAKVTLTAKEGYQFAEDVNPTVTDATISDKSVSSDGSKLEFKAAFAKTGDKDNPVIATIPTASAIEYGKTLYNSSLNGGEAKVGSATVAGKFTWKDPNLKPEVKDSNSTEYEVVFTPTDTESYESVTCKVKLTINKKKLENLAT